MHKIILFLCLVCVAPGLLRAQRPVPPRIIEYKTKLPLAQGEEKGIYLIGIAKWYTDNGLIMSDSALTYTRLAFDHARQHNYKRLLCMAANLHGRALLQTTNPDEGIKYYRLTVNLAHELGNDTMLALGYRGIGEALWYQSNFRSMATRAIMSWPLKARARPCAWATACAISTTWCFLSRNWVISTKALATMKQPWNIIAVALVINRRLVCGHTDI
jgi:hypothetical protein